MRDLPPAPFVVGFGRSGNTLLRSCSTPIPSSVTDVRAPDGTLIADLARRQEIHRFVASPPTRSRIGRWRSELPPADVCEFELIAGDLLAELGYAVGGG